MQKPYVYNLSDSFCVLDIPIASFGTIDHRDEERGGTRDMPVSAS
jgi:hypothetical protein